MWLGVAAAAVAEAVTEQPAVVDVFRRRLWVSSAPVVARWACRGGTDYFVDNNRASPSRRARRRRPTSAEASTYGRRCGQRIAVGDETLAAGGGCDTGAPRRCRRPSRARSSTGIAPPTTNCYCPCRPVPRRRRCCGPSRWSCPESRRSTCRPGRRRLRRRPSFLFPSVGVGATRGRRVSPSRAGRIWRRRRARWEREGRSRRLPWRPAGPSRRGRGWTASAAVGWPYCVTWCADGRST